MKKFAAVITTLSIAAAIIMYVVGSNSGHLSELKDFFWVPIPLAVLSLIIAFSKKKENI
ncbi:hypothetical protein [Winogradskyella sp.]|jgi:hypothetical protein|uniref:hypothetical protein n=1 Tax=Winogradskyella sp. TaxID=1883156 RepID=UPI003AB744AF